MEHLRKMREIELDYKNFYETTGFITLKNAIDSNEFQRFISSTAPEFLPLNLADLSGNLIEDDFFQTELDVSVIQHYRYMPALYHSHSFFELACVLSGSFTNFIEDRCITLKEGDIFILSPEIRHALCGYSEDCILINILIRKNTFEHHFMNILPNSDLLHSFFVKTLYHSPETPYLLFETGGDSTIRSHILQLYHEFQQNKRFKNTMLTSILSILFVHLLRNHEKDVMIPGTNAAAVNTDTVYILRYMQTNCTNITLSQLAEFFNYSERQIQRIITTATGQNFSENIKSVRMHYATELLKNPNLTVSEIAAALGYYDTSSFRHHFKNYYSMTPQEYRKRQS